MRGKVILITGASKGLGLSMANYWAKQNTVINLSRSIGEHALEEVHFFKCDLSQEAEINIALQQVYKKFNKIDLLINNAAVLTSAPIAITQSKDISSMIDLNLTAPILMSKFVFRKMMNARSGQIINVLSMASKLNVIGDAVYAATKGGLEAFAKILNKEGHPFGIHVNNIGISAFPSGMLDNLITHDENKIMSMIPHKQYAPLEEIISTIEFFEKNSNDLGGQSIYFGGI